MLTLYNFMLLLAAFKTLLFRCTAQSDVCVGSTFANRNRPELGSLIGLFHNVLILRTDLAGAPTFRELLRRVRATTLEAFSHLELPYKMVEEALQTEPPGGQLQLNRFMLTLSYRFPS